MSREIKFRAWDGIRITTSGIMFNSTNGLLEIPNGSQMKLMQYTGLKDENGVEIYEGDIIKFGNTNDALYSPLDGCNKTYNNLKGEVVYRECNFVITNVPTKFNSVDDNYWLGSPHTVMLEVIGNIYENPELLEAKS